MLVETSTGLKTGTTPHVGDGRWMRAMWRGMRLRCPACNQRTMFSKYITVANTCANCGEELHHQRADDAPPYFAIFIAGHLIIPGVLIWERLAQPDVWLQAAVWLPLSAVLMLALLPITKGALVGLQWALGMHGFGGEDELATRSDLNSNQLEFDANGSVRKTG